MKIKSQRDFIAGLLFTIAGVAFGIGSANYSMGSSARPGAGYFPLLLSVVMALLGAVVLFKSLVIETEGGDPVGDIAWKPLLVIVGAIVVFGATITRLGLVLSVPLLIIITSFAGDEFHWRSVLISAVILTFASWAIFIWGLGLTIPVWPNS
ncbi:MAG TPA: tripartite tricarboxylate transporter TctB family protein [Burkholderiaceae bacterium]|nr:tripartite tricarboxylate transporter TctB family protein [Burkholderiaceae bacterium]